ncbi:flagellar motor switch protein FliN [Polynucleobacter sp. Adler-ghost]|uniref:flagellar motor switch protein FliN n=1 Tax=Polynucleobacter sp. Adler-ghost TaxID=2770234 RepID=UPI001BFECB4A|nr:flagellar motor switch protein FliN [Polynucleobacter sp. Adler-ghost]QWE31178.1 flagellar motor switch protein FliN [Polynucleobacter sp. Adler-ghost]
MAENDNDLAKTLTSADVSGSLRKATFNNLEDGSKAGADFNDIDLVMDVPVQVTVELGRAKMQIRNLLNLTYGSVIELDILAGEPLEVVVNGCLVAQGEVVIVNDRYGIRLTDIVTPAERLRKINR